MNNPYIPDHVKDSIRQLNAENQSLKQEIQQKDVANEKLKNELTDMGTVVERITEQTEKLKQAVTDLYDENSQLKATNSNLQKHIRNLAGLVPEQNTTVEVQGGIADQEAVNVLGRLKKIWNDLMILYIETNDMPDITRVKDLEFVLDQIDISVLAVSRDLRTSQGKSDVEPSSNIVVSNDLI